MSEPPSDFMCPIGLDIMQFWWEGKSTQAFFCKNMLTEVHADRHGQALSSWSAYVCVLLQYVQQYGSDDAAYASENINALTVLAARAHASLVEHFGSVLVLQILHL